MKTGDSMKLQRDTHGIYLKFNLDIIWTSLCFSTLITPFPSLMANTVIDPNLQYCGPEKVKRRWGKREKKEK